MKISPLTVYLYSSLKRETCLSLKKGNLYVHQKGQPVCSSKTANYLSIKKGNLYVPQKGQPVCPSKRAICCPYKRVTYFSLKSGSLFVPKKARPKSACIGIRKYIIVLHLIYEEDCNLYLILL